MPKQSPSKNIQLQFLERVKSAAPTNVSFVDELADLLETSNDSAYRRLRGETLLSIDEIALICSHFKVPFETTVQPGFESVNFSYLKLGNEKESFKKWLQRMLDDVKRISSVPNSHILYAADDVPIWHHFVHSEFICFKLFYWQKSILNIPELEQKIFDPSLIDEKLVVMAKELHDNYNQTVSTEIWTEDTLNSTLKQIEYFWESGFFANKETALRMCDYIEAEVTLLKKKAENSSKLPNQTSSNFMLYQSEVMIGNNSILVTLGNQKIAYVSNNTFNMMSTASTNFVQENEEWLKNLVRKSILISGVSEKQRNRFFKTLLDKIDTLRKIIG
jgi:hypothetical protein